jgi:hypothetical protein
MTVNNFVMKKYTLGAVAILALLVFLCSGCAAFIETIAHDIKYRNDSVEFYYEIEDFDM